MTARRLSLLGFMFLAWSAAACSSEGEGLSPDITRDAGAPEAGDIAPPCGPSTLLAGTFALSFAGVDYGYVVHLPPSYDGTKRTPLVLNWHGLTSNAAQQQVFSAFDAVADEEGLIVVYPNSPDASWNAGTCCASATMRDDVGFARALVAEISGKACVDAKRIYSTGMSNGAFMSFRLGCEAADLFAAVAPVAGKIGVADCRPARSVPLLAIHGTADTLVPYATGGLSADMMTVPETAKKWADLDACTEGPNTILERGNARCESWTGCKDGATVTLCTVEGGGHCWPGQSFCPYGTSTVDIDASREIAAFFRGFKLP
ncbi:MAG TPA: PHB depolymerase family esterase [Polyangiaceae bacterium]|nr:PHB depolymerase family esterase [Polyangiaceae bacterium]